jgi:hypothetical protein
MLFFLVKQIQRAFVLGRIHGRESERARSLVSGWRKKAREKGRIKGIHRFISYLIRSS